MSNLLNKEKSAYLAQHAENPVYWHVWSLASLREAADKKKPIFISIGYSTCHWCHVMEKESFSDLQIAKILNKNFFCIKIDREERPDIDNYFMTAAHLLGVQGGWPLSVFALPDGKPFFIGTYFPALSRDGLPSFRDILDYVDRLWCEKNEEIIHFGQKAHERIADTSLPKDLFFKESFLLKNMGKDDYHELFGEDKFFFDEHWQYFDTDNGGFFFQTRVKFPCFLHLSHLLKIFSREKDERMWQMVEKTLLSLRMGGIYDQLAGGMSRYSVDYHWHIPHFEKMLYDQALYLELLTDFCRIALHLPHSHSFLAETSLYFQSAVATDKFLNEEFISPDGLYYSAIDAKSDGEEGSYYLWNQEEINDLLGKDAVFFFQYFYLVFDASLGKRGVLRALPKWLKIDVSEKKIIDKLLKKLLNCRKKRKLPQKDNKLLFGWNALVLAARCKWFSLAQFIFSQISGDIFPYSAKKHQQNIAQIKKMVMDLENIFFFDGEWFRRFSDGERKYFAQLSDLAAYGWALILVYTLTWESHFLMRSREIAETILQLFYDEEKKIFYETQSKEKAQLLRWMGAIESVEPGGQALVSRLFLYLSHYFDCDKYLTMARNIFACHEKNISQIHSSALLGVMHEDKRGFLSLKIICGNWKQLEQKKRDIQNILEKTGFFFRPHILQFKVELNEKICYIVCNESRCFPFVKDMDALERLLQKEL